MQTPRRIKQLFWSWGGLPGGGDEEAEGTTDKHSESLPLIIQKSRITGLVLDKCPLAETERTEY